LSLTAAYLPGAQALAFHLPAGAPSGEAIEQQVGVTAAAEPSFVLLADPYSCEVDDTLESFDAAFPRCVKVGGLASAGSTRGTNVLLHGENVHRDGVVGVAFTGNVQIDTLVAQGCRPVGEPSIVTRSRGNVVETLGKRTPLEVLRDLFDAAPEKDKPLL